MENIVSTLHDERDLENYTSISGIIHNLQLQNIK